MTRVTPERREVVTTRRITDTARVAKAEPLLAYRSKTVYFVPRTVVIEVHQESDGVLIAKKVVVKGWADNKPRSAFFSGDAEWFYAPQWLKDHMLALMTELGKKYGPDSEGDARDG